jgi:hypothetical protein
MVTWEACRSFFEPDGSLRDVYIRSGGLLSWRALLGIAREVGATFEVDGKARPLPASAEDALALRAAASPLLSIDWHGIRLNAHFFDEAHVELDLDPATIDSSARFESLLAFMRRLGHETRRAVALTPENCMNDAYLEVDPVNGVAVRAS